MKKIFLFFTAITLVFFSYPLNSHAAKLDDKTLEKKKEGWYPTGLPLINFSSDDGIGYGARLYMYYNGSRNDKYFDSTPYFMQIYAQYFATNKGYQYHELNLDMPFFLGTQYRIKAALVYEYELNANYFGQGADEAQMKFVDPTDPTNTFDKWSNYSDFIDDNEEYTKYYNYRLGKPQAYMYLYRNLTDELRVMVGGVFQMVTVETWNGHHQDSVEQTTTKLDEDRELLTGTEGGWTNFARFGVSYDARDFEPDPNKGYYLDYCFEVGTIALGSEYTWVKNTVEAQYYVNPIDELVFAFRLGYTASAYDVPFYEMDYFGFSLNRRRGVGGNRTLHGYKKSRFVARTMTVGNIEGRWEFADVSGLGQRFAFQLIGFCDTGNVYDGSWDPFVDPRFDDYKVGYGGGLGVTWNLATIVHFLYGRSAEDYSISIDFNYTF